MEHIKTFDYYDEYSEKSKKVYLEVGAYQITGRLYMSVIDAETHEECNTITCNFTSMELTDKNMAFIDGENNANFLDSNGLAEHGGEVIKTSNGAFPVFEFNEQRLKELAPAGYAEYEKAYYKRHPGERGEVKTIKTLEYCSDDLGTVKVYLEIGAYKDNGRLYIGLITADDHEFFMDLTVNLQMELNGKNQAFIDGFDSCKEEAAFIEKSGLARPLGYTVQSGYGKYPAYEFNEERLRELAPEEYTEYEKAYYEHHPEEKAGREVPKNPEKQRGR